MRVWLALLAPILWAGPALAQNWHLHRDDDGSMTGTLNGLPPGETVEIKLYAVAGTGDMGAVLAQHVGQDAAGAGSLIQEDGPKPGQLKGVGVVSDWRVFQPAAGPRLLHVLYAGHGRDGRIYLFRILVTADPGVIKSYMPVAAQVVGNILTAPPKQQATSRPPPPPASPQEKPLPVTALGQGLAADAIDKVIVNHVFGIAPMGLYNNYSVYLLLKDGRFYAEPVAAPADLDIAKSKAQEPDRWGRWSQSWGGTYTLTYDGGKQPESYKSGDVLACRPGDAGFTLNFHYSRTGGASVPGGISVLSEGDLTLRSDGSFSTASSVAVGGNAGNVSVGGGGSRPPGVGHYRIDGYTIELDPASGPAQRRFFCRYGDDDKLIFVGNSDWLVRQ